MRVATYARSDLSAKLTRLIDLLGYSQKQVADACGVSQQTISRWRSGASSPSAERTVTLMHTLDDLEQAARERLEIPDDDALEAARFLQARGISNNFAVLLPPHANETVKTYWNPEYQDLREELISRVPLLHVTVPLGHGATTMARDVERIFESKMGEAGCICVRLGVERLVATLCGITERDAYITMANALYGEPTFGIEHLGAAPITDVLANPVNVSNAAEQLIREAVQRELTEPVFRRSLGKDRHRAMVDLLERGGDDAWRRALEQAGTDLQLVVLLDLSPSPLGREYVDSADATTVTHRRTAQYIVSGAASATLGLPRASFFVLENGLIADLTELEHVAGHKEWERSNAPPLARNDLLEILAIHAYCPRNELANVIDPRFLPDLQRRGIASASWELRRKMEVALANEVDPAGVIRSEDTSAVNSFLLSRLATMEAKLRDLAVTQQALQERVQRLDTADLP